MKPTTTLLRRRTVLAGVAAALVSPLGRAQAAYPSRQLHLVVPTTPGSSVDNLGRALIGPLATGLGQPVVVDNVAGAGGVIGVAQIVRAPKDGYTFGIVVNHTISPYLYKLPYDPVKDVTAVSILVSGPMVLVVNGKSPVKNLADLLKLAKSRTGSNQLSYGSAGVGTLGHVAAALMESAAGLDLLHVPYKGQSPFTTDLLGGHVDFGFVAVSVAGPQMKDGNMRALAVTTPRRVAALADVPTMAEAGLPGYEVGGSLTAVVATGTPPAIIQKLHAEIVRAMRTPEMQKAADAQGLQIVASTPEEGNRFFAREFEMYGKLAQRMGLKPE